MTGIDLPISNLTTLFTSKLWTGNTNDFNGRIYDNEREDGINPELYISGKQYKEKLLNNNVDSTVFFRVTDYDPSELLADVSIYFSVNLATLYPTITTERADAYAIRDAKKWVDWSEFRIVDIIPGKPAFADYFGAEQNKHDMQPYFLFRIDTEVSYSIDACDVVTPTTYNLTLSSDANGTATSSVGDEGVIVVNSGELVAANAHANAGYQFSQWLRNTIPVSTNPYAFVMNQDIALVAEFIVSIIKQLSISVSGTGTTNPIPGNYDREQGTFQLIEAIETDDLYYFDEFKQDGLPLVGNPVNVEITDNTLVVAYFLEYLQYLFGDAPQKVSDLYYFINQTSFNLPVQIKQSQLAKFAEITGLVQWIGSGAHGYLVDGFRIEQQYILPKSYTAFKTLLCKRNTSESGLWSLSINNMIPNFFYTTATGVFDTSSLLTTVLSINTVYKSVVKIESGNIIHELYDGSDNLLETKTTVFGGVAAQSSSDIKTTFGNEYIQKLLISTYVSNAIDCKYKESAGTEIINRIVGVVNGTALGVNENDFWSEKSNYAEPLEIYPYTSFQQIADPTKFIPAIYDTAGNPTKTTITGYNLIAEIPANVVSNTGAVYSGIQIVGLEVDATFAEVLAIENSATVEITKDTNTVSLLKIKQ